MIYIKLINNKLTKKRVTNSSDINKSNKNKDCEIASLNTRIFRSLLLSI